MMKKGTLIYKSKLDHNDKKFLKISQNPINFILENVYL